MRVVDGAAQASPSSQLAVAAARADEAAVRELLSRGDRPNGENHDINTPLWLACASDAPAERRIAIATLLLTAGASPRQTGENQTTPLHQAARKGPIALVELLIREGALSWQPDRRGKTALDYARKGVASDSEQIVELLDRPVIRDPRFRAAVKAIHAGDVAALNGLLDRNPEGVEPTEYGRARLLFARLFSRSQAVLVHCQQPDAHAQVPANIVDVGRAMIARGVEEADLNYTRTRHEQWLTRGRQAGLTTLLVEAGANPTSQAIRVALAHLVVEPSLLLLDRGLAMTADRGGARRVQASRLCPLMRRRRTNRKRLAWPSSTGTSKPRACASMPALIPMASFRYIATPCRCTRRRSTTTSN
jgi:hypothetical protein